MTHYFKNIAQFKRKGMSNRAIALTLHLSRNTVNKAVKNYGSFRTNLF